MTERMTDERLKEIEVMLGEATKGIRRPIGNEYSFAVDKHTLLCSVPGLPVKFRVLASYNQYFDCKADMDFYIAAPTIIRDLLAEVRTLRRERDVAVKELTKRDYHDSWRDYVTDVRQAIRAEAEKGEGE